MPEFHVFEILMDCDGTANYLGKREANNPEGAVISAASNSQAGRMTSIPFGRFMAFPVESAKTFDLSLELKS